MKRTLIAILALAFGLAPGIQAVDSRIGELDFTHDFANGYPTRETVTKLYDEMDFQRACQAYLWALPLVGFAQWQNQHETVFGAGNGVIVSYISYDDKLGLLTANATTPYLIGFANLTETGPLVVEMPERGIYGGFMDLWQRPISSSAQGGKFLVVGPGQEVPKTEGYHVLRSPTVNIFIGFRVLVSDPQKAKAIVGQLKIFPLSKRADPPATRIVSPNGRKWNGTQPRGLAYWERLAEVINQEPVAERDQYFMAMLTMLGIEKGQPFNPDERQKKILTEAALVGEAMAKANTFEKRVGHPYWPDSHWKLSLIHDPLQRVAEIDQRAAWFYEAVTASDKMASKVVGSGSIYLGGYKDKDGDWLDGGKTYKLHVPPNVPMKQFWSVTVYDVDTRCLIENKEKIADRSSRMDLVKNADGSVDIYVGPIAPKGFEKNWIPSVPGKAWFTYFRLYAPTEAYFDKTWKLPDIEKAQ